MRRTNPRNFQDWFQGGSSGPNAKYNEQAFNSWTPKEQNATLESWQQDVNGTGGTGSQNGQRK